MSIWESEIVQDMWSEFEDLGLIVEPSATGLRVSLPDYEDLHDVYNDIVDIVSDFVRGSASNYIFMDNYPYSLQIAIKDVMYNHIR